MWASQAARRGGWRVEAKYFVMSGVVRARARACLTVCELLVVIALWRVVGMTPVKMLSARVV